MYNNNMQLSYLDEKRDYHYQDNFWQGYQKLNNNYMEKRREYSKMYYIFDKLITLQESYSDGLNELVEFVNYQNNNTTLNKGIHQFLEVLKKESDCYKELSNDLKNQINDEIRSFIKADLDMVINTQISQEEQQSKGEEINFKDSSLKSVEQSYINNLTDLETKKNEFHKEIKNALQLFLEKKSKHKKYEDKNNNKVRKAKEEFVNQLRNADEMRKTYIEKYNEKTLFCETVNRNYILTVQKWLRDFAIEKKKCLNKVIDIIESIDEIVNDINVDSDIKSFVKSNKTQGFPPFQLEFINYSLEVNDLKDPSLAKDKENGEVIQKFLSNFSENDFLNRNSISKEQVEKIKCNLNLIFKDSLSGEDFDEFIHLLKSNLRCQTAFLSFLNGRRTETYKISNKAFDQLSFLLLLIIKENENRNEFEVKFRICGWCIILSQTYYKAVDGKKMYLQDVVEKSEIFKNVDFWIGLCKYYIAENMSKKRTYNDFVTNLDDVKSKMNSIALLKVMTIIHNMSSYHVADNVIDVSTEKLCEDYTIDKEQIKCLREMELANRKNSIPDSPEEEKKGLEGDEGNK